MLCLQSSHRPTRDDIQLQLEAQTRIDLIAQAFQVNERQVYQMHENLRIVGDLAPYPAQFQVQSRPRLVTPEAYEGVLDL